MKSWLPFLFVLLIFSSAGFSSSRNRRPHGAVVFDESGCLHCHTIGKNGGSTGPNLSGVGRKLKEAQMRRQIVNGGKVMPPFGNVLDEKDLADLLSFLHSCRDKIK